MVPMKKKIRTYRATELKQSIGEVLIAAAQGPVYISKHHIPRYVLMTIDAYRAINSENVNSRKCNSIKCDRIAKILAEASKLIDTEQAHSR